MKRAAPLSRGWQRFRTGLRWFLGIAYFIAGLAHIVRPAGFIKITPDWVPYPAQVIFATGLAELAGAVALLFVPPLRKAAGIGLALYALCVYPANIKHAMEGIAIGGTVLGWGYHAPRLALQPVLIWAALFASAVMDWPARKS